MALPSPSLAKLGVIGLATAVVGAVFVLATAERPLLPARASKADEPPERRGDDPTYAEELKKMTALLQDMRYQFNQAESQRILDRDQAALQMREAAQRAIQQSKEDIGRLNKALDDAKTALDEKIKDAAAAPASAALRAEIDRLKAEQEALRQKLADAAAGGNAAAASRPEANRILAPGAGGGPGPRPNDAAPGPVQVAPGLLDPLRQMPGLDGFADRLAARAEPAAGTPAAAGRDAKTAAGLAGDYVTLNPYVAGDGPRATRAAARADPATATSLEPKRYPFAVKAGKDGATASIPVHTIPDAATLVDNSTMTPLVGRIPFRGTLRDPFRFKLITGATNLASNGHRIPGVANAVWTGYAVGVREQSCVRAYIDTVTFTFEDGRLHTVRKGKGNTDAAASVDDNLGYLTDRWGKPCIRGRYFNNAGSYLRDRGIAAFLDGLANAYANAKVTYDRADGVLSSYVSGNTYEYALGKGVSGATGEIADYARDRAEGAFDVIYVPPGIHVQIFVEAQIAIDYHTDGRKLGYDYARGVSYEHLD